MTDNNLTDPNLADHNLADHNLTDNKITDSNLKRMNRRELLELLIKLTDDNEQLTSQNDVLQWQLNDRVLDIQEAGSIAEASIKVNGVFEAAQKASEQYLENLQRLSNEAQSKADQILQDANQKAEIIKAEAKQQAETQLQETQVKCQIMLQNIQKEVDTHWVALKAKLDKYCEAHEGLRSQLDELLGMKLD